MGKIEKILNDLNKFRKAIYLEIILTLVILLVLPLTLATSNDVYKPYLHNPTIPENPGLNLQGSYQTALWPGAATYSYPVKIPQKTNGLDSGLYAYFASAKNSSGNEFMTETRQITIL